MPRDLHDHYFREAKREGYRSRAAYKLIEIDERRKILRAGDVVLDCGAAPGSWLQVASRRVGPKGLVVGVDLQPISGGFDLENVVTIQRDLREITGRDLLGPVAERMLGSAGSVEPRRFDVLLSDMAPSTTGDRTIDHHQSVRLCHTLLDLAGETLKEGGRLVMKVFEGEAYPDLLARARSCFDTVKGFKPKASRSISREMFVTALGYRGVPLPEADAEALPPRRGPSRGWSTS